MDEFRRYFDWTGKREIKAEYDKFGIITFTRLCSMSCRLYKIELTPSVEDKRSLVPGRPSVAPTAMLSLWTSFAGTLTGLGNAKLKPNMINLVPLPSQESDLCRVDCTKLS